jgi:predicted dithiol-disulfide oxidoreductase (DUF899 family)
MNVPDRTPLDAADAEIAALEAEIERLHAQLSEARRRRPAEHVHDHEVVVAEGSVPLSSLFGAHDDLLLIHNMGRTCAYCTLWADGFNGFLPQLESRAAVVLLSPDDPATQAEFAASRGWRFRMASSRGSDVSEALGYEQPGGYVVPGVSALRRDPDGSLRRTGKAVFGPGDDYCGLWHLFDLLEGGVDGWGPRVAYR